MYCLPLWRQFIAADMCLLFQANIDSDAQIEVNPSIYKEMHDMAIDHTFLYLLKIINFWRTQHIFNVT